ncbi:MAG: outer membrane protein, partial [Rhodospirillaceae bacterium]
RLMVKVVENPIINRIAFEGNLRLKDEVLEQEIQMRPRMVYTRTKVQNDVQRLIDLYRRRGRFAATVEPKVVQREQNRVDLVFEITEGEPTYVQRISFVGNRAYSDSTLRELLATREERWYRFLTSNDTYDPDRLAYDRELLRRFYLQHGYMDFRIVSAVVELSPDREGFFMTFTIEEGARYRYGDITVEAKLPALRERDLSGFIIGTEGDWYNATHVEESIQKLTDAGGAMGHAFVEIRPRLERDREKRVVDITYDIEEGPRVFIERIDITGNARTLDKVIRREFRVVEGDAFNTAKLRRSRQRIENLDFFEKVEINSVPSEILSDRTVIKVDVEEKPTGSLSFGVGWSTTTGAMMEIGLRERNLLGRGQDLRTALTLGQRRVQIDLSFTEPYFLDRDLAAGFDVFALQRNLQRESSHDSSTIGGTLRVGFSYNEWWRQQLSYTAKRDKIENVKDNASALIRQQEGTFVQSSVGQTIVYDTRDSRIHPTEGHVIRLSNDIAGLGGSDQFLRTNLDAIQCFPLGEQWILKLSADAGYVFGLGKDVRIGQRYFLGGDNLRGFAVGGVGPRDKTSKDALGGNWLAAGTVEVIFPLGLPKELGIDGKMFSDFGTLGPFNGLNPAQVDNARTIRASVGAGIAWQSPMGPLSIDVGFPVRKETFDRTEHLRFNFGTRF